MISYPRESPRRSNRVAARDFAYPLSQLGRGLSFNTVVATSAASLAPTAGGAVLAVARWPWLFAIVVPFGLLSILICLAFLPASPKHFDIVWRVAICGIASGMFFSPNARQIVGSAPVERAAAAGALVSTIRGAGQTLGATTVAALLAAGIGIGSTPPLIAAGLALIAGFCSLAVLRPATPAPDSLSHIIGDG